MNGSLIAASFAGAITSVIVCAGPALYASRLNRVKPEKLEAGASLTFFSSRLWYIPAAWLITLFAVLAINARTLTPKISPDGVNSQHGFAVLVSAAAIGLLIGLRFHRVYIDNEVVEYRHGFKVDRIKRAEIVGAYASNWSIVIRSTSVKRFTIPLIFAKNKRLLAILKYTNQVEKMNQQSHPATG